jgi:hypothetical protein
MRVAHDLGAATVWRTGTRGSQFSKTQVRWAIALVLNPTHPIT